MAEIDGTPGLALTASRRGESAPLFPEQAALFDLVLRNQSGATVETLALEGNLNTPMFIAYDGQSNRLAAANLAAAQERSGARMGEPAEEPATVVQLAPGQELDRWLDLWFYMEPLPIGSYYFEGAHRLRSDSGSEGVSNRVPFEIVPARVSAAATGYESGDRRCSLLAWMAASADGEDPVLLMRLSAFHDHAGNQRSGTSHGRFTAGSRLALGEWPAGRITDWTGWVAVAEAGNLHLICHAMGAPMWRSQPVRLGFEELTPVPRFPVRSEPLFLATGVREDGSAVLAGVTLQEETASSWTAPLAALPKMAACTFGVEGPVALLFAAEAGGTSTLSRMDVDENGALGEERVVYTTSNRILAIAPDNRVGAPLPFIALEADPIRHDRVGLIGVPLEGAAEAPELKPMEGWPSIQLYQIPIPMPAVEVCLEVARTGIAWLALTDEAGSLFGGPMGKSLARFRLGGEGKRASLPHVVAFRKSVAISSFTETGALYHAGLWR